MWTVLKFDKKALGLLTKGLKEKLGKDLKIYAPKLRIQKYHNNKLINKELSLLGDYMFCFHKDLKYKNTINSLRFVRGLKYFLDDFNRSQKDLEEFIKKCKDSESEEGFISRDFFDLDLKKKYKFASGPFSDKIFQIIDLQRNKIKVLMGNIKTTIKRKEFLFTPA
tara:strand:- start:176 stop:673 length:498 start_codon:yes stop_codon:yes gene_type:complete